MCRCTYVCMYVRMYVCLQARILYGYSLRLRNSVSFKIGYSPCNKVTLSNSFANMCYFYYNISAVNMDRW